MTYYGVFGSVPLSHIARGQRTRVTTSTSRQLIYVSGAARLLRDHTYTQTPNPMKNFHCGAEGHSRDLGFRDELCVT